MARVLERRVAGAQRRYLKAMDALLRLRAMGFRRSMIRLSAGLPPATNEEYFEEEEENEMLEEGEEFEE